MTLEKNGEKWTSRRANYYDKVEQESEVKEEGGGGKTKGQTPRTQNNRTGEKNASPYHFYTKRVRRFWKTLEDSLSTFGPATLRRNVGTILTPNRKEYMLPTWLQGSKLVVHTPVTLFIQLTLFCISPVELQHATDKKGIGACNSTTR